MQSNISSYVSYVVIELGTKVYNLASKFFHLAASWLQSINMNFEPCSDNSCETIGEFNIICIFVKYIYFIPLSFHVI